MLRNRIIGEPQAVADDGIVIYDHVPEVVEGVAQVDRQVKRLAGNARPKMQQEKERKKAYKLHIARDWNDARMESSRARAVFCRGPAVELTGEDQFEALTLAGRED